MRKFIAYVVRSPAKHLFYKITCQLSCCFLWLCCKISFSPCSFLMLLTWLYHNPLSLQFKKQKSRCSDLSSLASVLKQQITLLGHLCRAINLSLVLSRTSVWKEGNCKFVNCGQIFLFVFSWFAALHLPAWLLDGHWDKPPEGGSGSRDSGRWGVWLGQYTCRSITQVS